MRRVVHIPWRYRQTGDNPVVAVQGLVGQAVRPPRLARTVEMARFRIGPADPLFAPPVSLFDLFGPFPAPFSSPAFQLFLLISVQPPPIVPRFLLHLHQML